MDTGQTDGTRTPPTRRLMPAIINGLRQRLRSAVRAIMSDKTRVEQRLQELNAQLERRVQERTRELEISFIERARLAQILDATTDLVALASLDGRTLYINTAGKRMLGYEPDTDESRFNFQDLYPDDVLRLLEDIGIPEAIEKGTWSAEVVVRHRDGHLIPVSLVGIVHRSADGKPTHLSAIARDITEQKRTQEKLEAALTESRRLAAIIENTTDYVGMASLDGQSIYVNRNGLKMVGKPEIWEAFHVSTCHPESEHQKLGEMFNTIMAGNAWSGETLVKHRSGFNFPVSVVAFALHNEQGDIECVAAIMRDIRAQKAVEVELREARGKTEQALSEARRLSDILESTSDFVGMATAEGVVTYVNSAGIRLIGLDPERDSLDLTFDDIFTPEFIDRIQNDGIPAALREGSWKVETVLRHRDGTEIPVSFVGCVHTDANGEPHTLSCIARDISNAKRQELALEAAKNAAEMANHAKSQFLANMSHELRTPLNGILGYTQILQKDRELSDRYKESVAIIEHCGEHLLTLINDILDLSKIEAGRMELYERDFHFEPFLNNIVDIVSTRAEIKGISFSFEKVSNLPGIVHGDDKKLKQIILNLVGNAIKFTDEGGVVMKVGYHNERIRFQIEDSGIGIPTEKLEEIFLPFHQIGDKNRTSEGTGLGLAITRQLVELMQGELTVQSTAGKGSLFAADIFLNESRTSEAPRVAKRQNIIGYHGPKRRAMVVDDKVENRAVLAGLLTMLGFEVQSVTDGLECLDRLDAIQPDVIFMDMRMPNLDGRDASRRIRQMKKYDDVIIVAISASAFQHNRQDCIDAGCDDFIAKPFRESDITSILQRHLNLDWIVEETRDVDPAFQAAVVPPPGEYITTLIQFANLGDIQAMTTTLEEIGVLDAIYQPFVETIGELLRHFEIKQVRKLLQKYADQTFVVEST